MAQIAGGEPSNEVLTEPPDHGARVPAATHVSAAPPCSLLLSPLPTSPHARIRTHGAQRASPIPVLPQAYRPLNPSLEPYRHRLFSRALPPKRIPPRWRGHFCALCHLRLPQILLAPSFYSTLLFASQRGDGASSAASSAASSVDQGVVAALTARVANFERRFGTEFKAIYHKARTPPPAAPVPPTHACATYTFELLSHPWWIFEADT